MQIKCLQAEHGDAFIIEIGDDSEKHFIVVDGGPSSKYCIDDILKELNNLSSIDLMILTHFDDDHIAGLIEYVREHKTDFPVKRVWANCSKDIVLHSSSNISYLQAYTLESLLVEISKKHSFLKDENIENSMQKIDLGFCKIQILSPTIDALRINKEEYEKIEANIASSRVEADGKKTLEELASNTTKQRRNGEDIVNRSSIAFVIEADGKSILMMGDADPWIVYDKLKDMGYTEDTPLMINLMKISHHGSRNNTCNELLDVLKCDNYIISTNGGYGSSFHPDREVLAKLLCHPRREKEVTLYFNYALDEIEERVGILLTEEERKMYNCRVVDRTSIITIN